MKKALIIAVALCICFSVFSQENEKAESQNELKFNLFMTVISFPEITYERILSSSIGIGVTAGFPIEKRDTKYQITPFCRFYFSESTIKSFFIEANAAILGVKEYYFYSDYKTGTNNSTDFGLGFAFGYKYINKSGFIGELSLGLGRTFENRFYPRVGVSIGKSF
jgi:hypothetical protein